MLIVRLYVCTIGIEANGFVIDRGTRSTTTSSVDATLCARANGTYLRKCVII